MVRAALAAIATLCALVPAGLAGAAPPAGVREAPKLEPAASWVAGKAVKVWCDPSLDEARGEEFALVGGDEFRLDMITCSLLHARLAGKSTPPALLVEALRILAHQAAHAGGIQDESET